MENINRLLDRAAQSIGSTRQSLPASASATSEKRYNVEGERLTLLELLWKRMTEIYGHRWTSAYGSTPVDGWDMCVSGLEPEQIRSGLKKMVLNPEYQKWPPAALEFRALCLPTEADLGLPSLTDAFQQAVGNRPGEKHPAVIHTLRQTDAFALRRMPAEAAMKIWTPIWAETVRMVAAGGELPERQAALPDGVPTKTPENKRDGHSVLMDVMADIGPDARTRGRAASVSLSVAQQGAEA